VKSESPSRLIAERHAGPLEKASTREPVEEKAAGKAVEGSVRPEPLLRGDSRA
jgi:hypothetical protein